MSEDILLNAKLHVPQLRGDYLPRPQLVARLQEGLTRKLTLISTPAGFGKTTILCEWLKQNKLQAAWVSLDEGDNDHGRFISYVMAALRTLNTGFDENIQEISRAAMQGVPLESPMMNFLNVFSALPATTPKAILILDDYHVIHNQDVHQSMTYALDYLPDNIHIVIATRTDPPLPIARMRARRQMTELRAKDLRFSTQELKTFLNQVSGLGLSAENLAAIEDRTEGWIAGLQLAAVAMSGRHDIDHFVRAFTGSNRYILDYLADEVFNRQPEDVRNFLLKTSILEQMTGGLCDAVTGLENGSRLLERLERENLFIVPLDTQGQWYRYHHLFADLLRSRVDQLPLEENRVLHHRASLWYEANRQTYEAIEHALDAHEFDLAVTLMVKASPALVMRSEVTTLFKWLNSLPQEMKFANPRIPLMYAWAHFFMTDISSVETHISDAFHALQIEDHGAQNWPESFTNETGEMLAQINALRTFVAVNRDDPYEGIRIANYALVHLPKDEKLGRFSVLAALGDAYRDADNFAAASQTYSEALAISEIIDQSAASLTMRMDLARLRVKMGQLRHAKVNCNEVLARSDERYHFLFPVAQAYSLLGDLLREQNDLEQAEQVLNTSIQQCEWAGYLRYLVFSQVSAARLKFAVGDHQGVERFLEAASQSASMSGSEPLRAWVSQFRVRLLKNEESAWLAEHKLSLADEALFPREDEYLTFARLHLDRARRSRLSDPQAVFQLLDRLLISAQKSARVGSAIEILMLQAMALKLLEKDNDAIQKVRQSLVLAEPEGYVRLFVDEGAPMADLLLLAIQHNIQPEYANRLLHLIDAQRVPISGNLSEPLTVREGEVLRLLAVGLSNQEIAERLVISLSTIKTHITRIYGKLDVTSRTQAIARGRELNLL